MSTKKKNTGKKSGSKVAKRATEGLLRMKDLSKEPTRKGGTADSSIGSKCKRCFSLICKDSHALDSAKTAYKDVVGTVKQLPDDIARAVCLAACSDYTLSSLIASAKDMKGNTALSERDSDRIAAIQAEFGDEDAETFKRQLLWAKGQKRSA